MDTKTVGAKNFFGPIVCGLIIGLIIAAITVFFFSRPLPDKVHLRYKRALFQTVAGHAEDIAPKEDLPEVFKAIETGSLLVDLTKRGMPLADIVESNKIINSMVLFAPKEFQLKVIEYLKKLWTVAEVHDDIFLALTSDAHWYHILNDAGDVKVLTELLAGKGEVPVIDDADPKDPPWLGLAVICFCQVIAFFTYLCTRAGANAELRRNGYPSKVIPWYKAPWGKPGTYVSLALLMPGALVIILPAGFLHFCSLDLKQKFSERRERKNARSIEEGAERKRNTLGSGVTPDDSKNLLGRLRSRVSGGES